MGAVGSPLQAKDEMNCLFNANDGSQGERITIGAFWEQAVISCVFPFSGGYVKLAEKGGKNEQYYILDGACHSAGSGRHSFRLSSSYASRR
jgi:hypothetical protein